MGEMVFLLGFGGVGWGWGRFNWLPFQKWRESYGRYNIQNPYNQPVSFVSRRASNQSYSVSRVIGCTICRMSFTTSLAAFNMLSPPSRLVTVGGVDWVVSTLKKLACGKVESGRCDSYGNVKGNVFMHTCAPE